MYFSRTNQILTSYVEYLVMVLFIVTLFSLLATSAFGNPGNLMDLDGNLPLIGFFGAFLMSRYFFLAFPSAPGNSGSFNAGEDIPVAFRFSRYFIMSVFPTALGKPGSLKAAIFSAQLLPTGFSLAFPVVPGVFAFFIPSLGGFADSEGGRGGEGVVARGKSLILIS